MELKGCKKSVVETMNELEQFPLFSKLKLGRVRVEKAMQFNEMSTIGFLSRLYRVVLFAEAWMPAGTLNST